MLQWFSHEAGCAGLKGLLDRKNLVKLPSIKCLLVGFKDQLNIDLSGVDEIDSAGVAFILELKEAAEKNKLEVNFHGTTDSLNKLKSLYNLDKII